MEPITESCRLCLDPFAENALSIESPQLKEQMETVFNFPVETMEGYPSRVCQSCSYTISEFYVYSKKVRTNQDQLQADPKSMQSSDYKSPFEDVKLEQPETLDCDILMAEPKEEQPSDDDNEAFSEGEVFAETYEPPARRTRNAQKQTTKRKRMKKPPQDNDDSVNADEGEASEKKSKRKYDNKSKEEKNEEFRQIYEFYKLICDVCGHATDDFPSLDQHFHESHGRDGYIVCCNRKLFKRSAMYQHMIYHANPNAFRCDTCKKSYKSKEYLTMHFIKIHGSEDDRPYKCKQCPQSFAKKHTLRAHAETHEKAQCPKCDRMLSSKLTLRAHMINMHSDVDRRMICDTCGQEFLNKASFERHVQEHMGIEVLKRYQCHLCKAWLRGERGLEQHLRHLHYEREQTHICNICGKQSANSRALAKHKRVVHVEEKYECEFCGAKFKQAVNLKEHRTIHTGEVLYSCEYCGVAKNSKSNLYVHIKNSHPVEWAAKKRKAEEAKIPKT